jgi:hypothetical protein
MPVDIEVRHDNQVMLVIFRGVVTADEVKRVVETFIAVCDNACTKVHFIADASQVIRVPPGVVGLALNRRSNPIRHPNAGLFIIVSHDTLIMKVVRALAMSAPTSTFKFADSLDDALRQLRQVLV